VIIDADIRQEEIHLQNLVRATKYNEKSVAFLPGIAWLGSLHFHPLAHDFALHAQNGIDRFFVFEGNEAEATGSTGVAIHHHHSIL
jgi:hypothetical protein